MKSRSAALFISYIFHPIFLPTYIFAVLFFLSPEIIFYRDIALTQKFFLLTFIFIYTVFFPFLMVWLLYKRNEISDLHLKEQKERTIPYLTCFLVYLFLAFFLYSKQSVFATISYIILIFACSTLFTLILNFFWKISAHMVGIAGALGIFSVLYIKYDIEKLLIPVYLSILLAGLIGSARLKLNSHSLFEVFLGFELGLIISTFGVYFFL